MPDLVPALNPLLRYEADLLQFTWLAFAAEARVVNVYMPTISAAHLFELLCLRDLTSFLQIFDRSERVYYSFVGKNLNIYKYLELGLLFLLSLNWLWGY